LEMPPWRFRSGDLACAMVIAVATATAASVVVAAGAADGEAEFDYRKLSGIIIPGFASTQLRAWSVLDCPYSPFDFNPLDSVWLDSTKVEIPVLHRPKYPITTLVLAISVVWGLLLCVFVLPAGP
uniref:Uncharacterized protein n=1 Tax=Aegilops tauschii subsp. strangulata TaxID=200361 RepID=A0A453PIX8_AEGTS